MSGLGPPDPQILAFQIPGIPGYDLLNGLITALSWMAT